MRRAAATRPKKAPTRQANRSLVDIARLANPRPRGSIPFATCLAAGPIIGDLYALVLSGVSRRLSASIVIGSPSCTSAINPPTCASGATWPTTNP